MSRLEVRPGPGPGEIVVTCPPCPLCGKRAELVVPQEGFERWRSGEYIQVALRAFPPDEREMLMTGYHSACWDIAFPDE